MRTRLTSVRGISLVGTLCVSVAIASAASAAADPAPPPADPGVAPPPQTLNDALAQPMTSLVGAPANPGVPVDLFLSQYAVPSAPGAQPTAPLDPGRALSGSSYLLPQNFKLAGPDESNIYGIGQGDASGRPRLIPSLKGAHALWHGGMGRLSPEQLGEPLPGTAPPPGTNLPPGPLQYLPDPPPWPQPVPPGAAATDVPPPPTG